MQSALPSTMVRYRDHLQTTPWLSLLGYGLLIIFYGVLISLFLPHAWQKPFMRALLVAPVILIVVKDLACFPLSLARFRSASAAGAPWRLCIMATLPPELPAWLRMERAMWRGFFSWVFHRHPPARPAGTPLGYLERGSYGTVICCALVSLCVEIPLDTLIASVMAKSAQQARVLHGVFGAIALYGFVWVTGDRWNVLGRRHHVLTDTSLELDIGVRGCGIIPLDAVASCERLNESRAAWCKRHGLNLHATRKVSPFDGPNLVLLLKPGCDVRLNLMQQERGGDGPVFLYLDRPEVLCAALAVSRN
jgi:hypothetical protein